MICYHLTCGFRAQAENEQYRISVVATNTMGILEFWIICGDRGSASSDEAHNVVPLRHWWQQGRSQPGSVFQWSKDFSMPTCFYVSIFFLGWLLHQRGLFEFFLDWKTNKNVTMACQPNWPGHSFKVRVLTFLSTSHYTGVKCSFRYRPNYNFLLRLLRFFFGLGFNRRDRKKEEWATLQNCLLYQVD